MKNLFLFFAGLTFFSTNVFSQAETPAPVANWAFPAIYEMDQEVTFYVDLSGGGWDEGDDVYWWVWQPSEPDAGNFALSSEFAKWEYTGNLIWKKTFIPTEYFHMTKEQVLAYAEQAFWCRLKDLTGTKQSAVFNFRYPDRTPNDVLDGNMFAADPVEFTVLTQTSIYFDAKLANGFSPGEDVFLNSQINNASGGDDYAFNYDDADPGKTKMIYLGDGIYRKDIDIINYYFIPGEDDPSQSIVDGDYDLKYIKGSVVNGNGGEAGTFEYAATSLDPGIPAVYLLPSNLTFYDIFAINRVNPQKGEEPISYIITCSGFPNISGQLERIPNSGADKNRAVFIYLPQYWEKAPTQEIRIRLTGANNVRFFDSRITLMPVEE